jgi:hypothetical protein
MVGAAIAEANGIVPPGWVQAGLTVPYVLQFPLAPAEGLLLVSQGFTAGKTGVYLCVFVCICVSIILCSAVIYIVQLHVVLSHTATVIMHVCSFDSRWQLLLCLTLYSSISAVSAINSLKKCVVFFTSYAY